MKGAPRFSRKVHGLRYAQIDRFRPHRGYLVVWAYGPGAVRFEIRPVCRERLRLPRKAAELERLSALLPNCREAQLEGLVQRKRLVIDYEVTCPLPLPPVISRRELRALVAVIELVREISHWLRKRFLNFDLERDDNSLSERVLYHCSFCGVVCASGRRLCSNCAGELLD
jgi:hypothetical protein